jgi:selenide, water dikinase
MRERPPHTFADKAQCKLECGATSCGCSSPRILVRGTGIIRAAIFEKETALAETAAGAVAQRLTAMAKAAGCAAKLNPAVLDTVLRRLPKQTDANVLVGFETSDDAGIYRISAELALVQTVDFFTPIADDPFTFGQIAAANALSDVYAMGGRPISALTILAFPERGDLGVLEQIMRGGLAKMNEAGCSVVGGHSIRDEELKFGYAVTGLIHPEKVWRNVGARAGDALIFTKALGTGVITTALKRGQASAESVAAAEASMTRLNRAAAEALAAADPRGEAVHAVTDVTGFSLLGHAREMALGDAAHGVAPVSLEIEHAAFEYLPGAIEAARTGNISQGLKNNRAFVGECAEFAEGIAEEYRALLFDPQTSGGLLIAAEPSGVENIVAEMQSRNVGAHKVGRVLAKSSPLLHVI